MSITYHQIMVRVLREAAETKSVKELLAELRAERNIRVHLYADSAEGPRSGMDRELASTRAASARARTKRAAA